MEEPDDSACAAACVPAYVTGGAGITETKGMHCSAFPKEFCFFCTYERNASATGTESDLYGSLSDMVAHLADMSREPSAIAIHVFDAYETTVRHHIEGSPSWTKKSILRHIMYSGQFSQIVDTSVGHMLNALIARQNDALVDAATNTVIEENRKAFCETVSTLLKWKAAQKNGLCGKSQGKKKF
tara:strand:+ start:396 stop:947 length:552 start_codon:yes stop_codon:yes gene_type:complete